MPSVRSKNVPRCCRLSLNISLVGKIAHGENHWFRLRKLYFQTVRKYKNEKSRLMARWGKKLYLPFCPPPHIVLSVFLIVLLLCLSHSREARRIVSNGASMTTKHGGKVRLGRLYYKWEWWAHGKASVQVALHKRNNRTIYIVLLISHCCTSSGRYCFLHFLLQYLLLLFEKQTNKISSTENRLLGYHKSVDHPATSLPFTNELHKAQWC